MMFLDNKKIHHFQQTVLDRYTHHKRDLPWRETTDPYRIRVSEIMLQQTQVDRVIPKYLHFLQLFPTVISLAQADKSTLLGARSGLGYNSRALNLQKAAQVIVQEYQGMVPHTVDQLKKLPGIGPYTAGAICAFAFNQEVSVVDINIKRVLIHTFGLDENIGIKDLETIAVACIPQGKSCQWHNALMDYGSSVLTSKKTGIKSAKQSTFQ
jgi:A/G-specific adenine glycosylase